MSRRRVRQAEQVAEREAFRRISGVQEGRYLVMTTLGNTILHSNSQVFARLGGNEFFSATVADLMAGRRMRLLFGKEGVDISEYRDRIEQTLLRGRVYRHSMGPLFEDIGGEGQWTTRLRQALWSGVQERPGEWPDSLGADLVRMILEGQAEPTPELCRLAARSIHERLTATIGSAGIHVVGPEQIAGGWLMGETIAPRNYKAVFGALAGMVPRLGPLADSPEFDSAYALYRAMRLSFSLRLTNRMSGQEPTAGDQTRLEGAKSVLSPEARRELDYLVADFTDGLVVTENLMSPDVLRVIPLGRQDSPEGANENRLRKGVLAELPAPETGIRVIKPIEICKRRTVLDDLVSAIEAIAIKIYWSDERRPETRLNRDHIVERMGYAGYADTMRWVANKLAEADIDRYGYLDDVLTDQGIQESGRFANRFYDWMLSNQLDQWLGLDDGSILKLMTAYARNSVARPREAEYAAVLDNLTALSDLQDHELARLHREFELVSRLLTRKGYARDANTSREFLRKVASARVPLGLVLTIDEMAIARGYCITPETDRIAQKLARGSPRFSESLNLSVVVWESERREILGQLGLDSVSAQLQEAGSRGFPFVPLQCRQKIQNVWNGRFNLI